MDNIIYIKSENLLSQVLFKLDKLDNGFTTEELNKVTDLVIDCDDERHSGYATLKELENFSNLEDLTIRNNDVLDDFIKQLSELHNLKSLTFEKCNFNNLNLLNELKLTSLSFISCPINNYSFITNYNLEELTITNDIVKMSDLNKQTNLKYLQLSYSNIDMDEEFNLTKLNELMIDNTNINNFDFLNKLTDLKTLSIDKNQYMNNIDLFKNLQSKGIEVLNESIVEFKGEDYEA